MIGLNIRDRSSIDLSLRKCRFQLRISARIAFTALSETAGLKLMKNFPLRFFRSPRPKRIAEKIELLVRIRPSPVIILAIDDLRLLRMKLQPTVLQASGYSRPNLLGLLLRSAMHDGIISETLKRQLRILLRHPPIKSIVQKQIG